ncbi:anion transporter [Actinobacillus ureae]|uniref:Sodium:sulfate symporter transmembrane region n=1 Tax=Actinobacillus ureae ATCC 25976 TaxID=887324 RepID=E8KGS3_9PAST|nr:sodium:sulfate symporter transmembrane region [Actinobacillus ureae ATCC 25976]SUT86060.1 anion transporter [Actinobacillus ureae]SUU44608.1 anion transporter [Actinobacillus ureae]
MVVKTTGFIFLTAMAPNAVALELMRPILNIDVSWTQWFLAASVPGLLTLLGIAAVLTQAKFFVWLSSTMSNLVPADLGSPMVITILLLTLSVLVRYVFASGAAYVASMVPVFCAVGMAAGADPVFLEFGLLFSNSYGSMVTHYASASAAVIYGLGYHDVKSFWIAGGVCALVTLFIQVTVGFGWWSMLQSMGILG